MARRRRRWIHYRDRIDPRRLVFIDETWIKTNMAPLRGWGTRGKRLIAHVPHGHWQTMTFIGALRHDRIEAPWVLDAPINAEAFKTYVRAELIKTLKPNDIVVLDNLNSRKGKAVRAMVKAAGARLFFLPSYSPDLTRSSRPSQKSSTRCEKPWAEPSRPSKAPSPKLSTPSHRRNARTTWQMPDTSQPKCDML